MQSVKLSSFMFFLFSLFLSLPALAQDLQTDEENCGALGYECVGGRECVSGRCSPAWIELDDTDAPTPRGAHSAVVVDGVFYVVGGCSSPTPYDPAEVSTAYYDLGSDSWSAGPDLNQSRAHFTAVVGDGTVYAWGGVANCWDGTSEVSALESLDSVTSESWTQESWPNEPPGRYNAGTTWAGSGLLVYGGSLCTEGGSATGGFFEPGIGWTDAGCGIASCERGGSYEMFYDAGVVRVWGGSFGSAPTGLQYDVGTGVWDSWTYSSNTLDVTYLTGSMGQPRSGWDDGRAFYLEPDGGITIYDRLSDSWTSDDVVPPSGLCGEASVAWSGSELVAWSGYCDSAFSTVGGRYQPPAP